MELKEKLQELYSKLMDHDNELLVLADKQEDPELLETVAMGLLRAAQEIKQIAFSLDGHKRNKESGLTLFANKYEELAEFATALDMSGDEELQKKAAWIDEFLTLEASVMEQLLINKGVAKTHDQVAKEAQEEEIARLRKEHREKSLERPYKTPAEEHERDIKAAEAAKAIKDSIKEYRPMETALSTRYCPDHPGTSVIRVADDTYQCPLDKGIYNYREGFTTMKGSKVPGTDVHHQTQALGDRRLEPTHFDTRETRLNQ
jgi:hypothetical protein